jgi:hypothetical protein
VGEFIGMCALLIAVSPCSLSTASRCAGPGVRWYETITRYIFTYIKHPLSIEIILLISITIVVGGTVHQRF